MVVLCLGFAIGSPNSVNAAKLSELTVLLIDATKRLFLTIAGFSNVESGLLKQFIIIGRNEIADKNKKA
jgi:hypothetical protein